MEDKRKNRNASNFLYRILTENLDGLTRLNLRTIENNFRPYGIAIDRILGDSPTPEQVTDFKKIQTTWYEDITNTPKLLQQRGAEKERDDPFAIVKVVQPEFQDTFAPSGEQTQKQISNEDKITDEDLRSWQENFIQPMVEKHRQLADKLPSLSVSQESYDHTNYLGKMFSRINKYVKSELNKAQVFDLSVERNKRQKQDPDRER